MPCWRLCSSGVVVSLVWSDGVGGESKSVRLWVRYTITFEDVETRRQAVVLQSTNCFDILDHFDDLLQP